MVIDLFAGPGGWDVGASLIGLEDPLGIELEIDACSTRRTAGLATMQGDVSALDPALYVGAAGLIASPPCKAFSKAGKREGIVHAPALMAAVGAHDWSARPSDDPLIWLLLEVGRWAETLRPEWIALEQVPEVLPIWKQYRAVFEAWGYSTWCGNVTAEQYGVPQTRQRAILVANRTRNVGPPPPTHERYDGRQHQRRQSETLGFLKPWVSMAEALGWGMTQRPYPVVACSRTTGGPDAERVGGSGAREQIHREHREGRWQLRASNDRPNACVRDEDEPAPTIAICHAGPEWLNTGLDWQRGGTREDAQTVETDAPAPAVSAKSGGQWQWRRNDQGVDGGTPGGPDQLWPRDRPATVIAGRDIVTDPGANANRFNGSTKSRNDGFRVTTDELLILQSFPPDYPVQGSKTAREQQIGNAIPPLLAAHVLAAATGLHVPS